MSFIDVVLLVSLWNSRKNQTIKPGTQQQPVSSTSPSSTVTSTSPDENNTNTNASMSQTCITTAIALLVAIVQLGVYNLMGYDEERQDMVGEPLGHLLEFSFEIISSIIAFWFCMDNKFVADKEIGLILYGSHPIDCQICEGQSTDFTMTHSGNQYQPPAAAAASSGPAYYQTV